LDEHGRQAKRRQYHQQQNQVCKGTILWGRSNFRPATRLRGDGGGREEGEKGMGRSRKVEQAPTCRGRAARQCTALGPRPPPQRSPSAGQAASTTAWPRPTGARRKRGVHRACIKRRGKLLLDPRRPKGQIGQDAAAMCMHYECTKRCRPASDRRLVCSRPAGSGTWGRGKTHHTVTQCGIDEEARFRQSYTFGVRAKHLSRHSYPLGEPAQHGKASMHEGKAGEVEMEGSGM